MSTMCSPPCVPYRQRGVATLVVTMLLLFTTMLVAGFVNRNLVFEQRMSVNQYRSTQAFEAAEAGLEWALAQLNNPQRLGSDCATAIDTAATSFRERYLSFAHGGATLMPRTWNNAGAITPLRPGCLRSVTGWTCSCPSQGIPALGTAGTSTLAGPLPAFSLEFKAGTGSGIVRVVATGCSSLAGQCQPGSTTRPDAMARLEVSLSLLGGLRVSPIAALTTRGGVAANAAAFGAHNPDPDTGIAIHAGADVAAAQARITLPAGAPLSGGVIDRDSALAGLTTDQFFVSYFGLDKARWQAQPSVMRVKCSGDCGAALAHAIASTDGSALLWIDGDLKLNGPVTLGSQDRPVALVVNGPAQLHGAITVHGVLYAGSIDWRDTSADGASVRGATLSESGFQSHGATNLHYDPRALSALKGFAGSFARVSGSWRDF